MSQMCFKWNSNHVKYILVIIQILRVSEQISLYSLLFWGSILQFPVSVCILANMSLFSLHTTVCNLCPLFCLYLHSYVFIVITNTASLLFAERLKESACTLKGMQLEAGNLGNRAQIPQSAYEYID